VNKLKNREMKDDETGCAGCPSAEACGKIAAGEGK
jgi:hypothetical protein